MPVAPTTDITGAYTNNNIPFPILTIHSTTTEHHTCNTTFLLNFFLAQHHPTTTSSSYLSIFNPTKICSPLTTNSDASSFPT
jgi:hypothetical protein